LADVMARPISLGQMTERTGSFPSKAVRRIQ
jgi:hypothetical protein